LYKVLKQQWDGKENYLKIQFRNGEIGEWSRKSAMHGWKEVQSRKSVSAWMESGVVNKLSFSMSVKGRGQESQFHQS
jgi:hypothetical protein